MLQGKSNANPNFHYIKDFEKPLQSFCNQQFNEENKESQLAQSKNSCVKISLKP